MKKSKVFSILCVLVSLVLVCTVLSACDKRRVDEEFEYNNTIETNANKPVEGEPEVEKISGFVKDDSQTILQLPYTIKDTELEITAIGKYSGYTSESDNNEEVRDIFAIIIRNNSEKVLSFSNITVEYDKNKTTDFSPTNIPPSQSSIVFTSTPFVKYEDVKMFEITDSMALMADSLPMIEDLVGVDFKDGNMIITNLTGDELGDVYVRYKNCAEGNVYLGGITYSVMASDVQPYETYTVPAEHFDEEHSVIIAVENIKQ